MELVAVLLEAAAGFGAGAVWYLVNGGRRKEVVGRTEAEIKADRSPLPFVIGFAGSLLAAGMMQHVLASAEVEGAVDGLVSGLGVGLFLVAPWIVTNYAFAARPKALWWIDVGHVVLACSAIVLVLGLFL